MVELKGEVDKSTNAVCESNTPLLTDNEATNQQGHRITQHPQPPGSN